MDPTALQFDVRLPHGIVRDRGSQSVRSAWLRSSRSFLFLVVCLAAGGLLAKHASGQDSPLLQRLLDKKSSSAKDPRSLSDSEATSSAATPSNVLGTDSPIGSSRRDAAVRQASWDSGEPSPRLPLPPVASTDEPPSLLELPTPQEDSITPPSILEEIPLGESLAEPDLEDAGWMHPSRGPRAHDGIPVNPLGLQQGAANLAFAGDVPTPQKSLGFPISVLPTKWVQHIPRLSIEFSLPETRSVGKGEPLVGSSWINRPLHVDLFSGGLVMGDLTSDGLAANNGMLTGTRLGWDVNHYVGGELRLAQATTGLAGRGDQADVRLYDVSVLYYPWGDSRLRPFTTLGFGVQQINFVNNDSISVDETLISMPFGFGFKYLARRNLALRFEFLDNLGFGSNVLKTQNSLSLTGGFEWRFGGHRRTFYPYGSGEWFW